MLQRGITDFQDRFILDLLCGECSGEKGMEKNYRLIEIPNKYSVNLERGFVVSLNHMYTFSEL